MNRLIFTQKGGTLNVWMLSRWPGAYDFKDYEKIRSGLWTRNAAIHSWRIVGKHVWFRRKKSK